MITQQHVDCTVEQVASVTVSVSASSTVTVTTALASTVDVGDTQE